MSTQLGHHIRAIESLEFTISADPSLIRKLKAFSTKRNATVYDSAGNVSSQELESAIRTATDLKREVIAWCRTNYPKLLTT